jgi:hypothetical protein
MFEERLQHAKKPFASGENSPTAIKPAPAGGARPSS